MSGSWEASTDDVRVKLWDGKQKEAVSEEKGIDKRCLEGKRTTKVGDNKH